MLKVKLLICTALVVDFALPCFSQTVADKKLICWSGDPDTKFLREHISEMEAMPFDGIVFRVDVTGPDKTVQFGWSIWGPRKFTDAEMQPAIDDLKATNFKRFKHNFLRVGMTPGNVDWFDDDFSTVLNNWRLAAKVAHAGGAAGIMFDVEQYDGNPFPFFYNQQRDAKTKTLDEYAAQARLRGRELMQTLQQEFPNIHVICTYGYCLPIVEARYIKKHGGDARYGLLGPLLDGMLNAATGSSKIIDGYEYAYGYKTRDEFDSVRKQLNGPEVFAVSRSDAGQLAKHFRHSYGVWLDFGWRDKGWDRADASKNYFTPESLEASIRLALEHTDEYVWLYNENPRWWTPDGPLKGKPQDFSPAYIPALIKSRLPQATANAVAQ